MAATNKLLAKRVDVLTDALVDVHDDLCEALASGGVDGLEETREHVKSLLGLEDDDEGSGDEESDEGSEDEEEDE